MLKPSMEEHEKERKHQELIWKPNPYAISVETNSMLSATLGRVMHTLLSSRPKKLQDAISRLSSPPKIAPLGGTTAISLEQSLWFLYKYVGEAAEKEETLDEVLVPMIEHSLKFRDSKHSNQSMILLNWLFGDENFFQALARNFADIIWRKDDHYIALGWCTLARGLVEYEISMTKLITDGIREKYAALLKILCSCNRQLLGLISRGSTVQGGFELPTRLAVASADFVLSLSVALTRKNIVYDISYYKGKLHDLPSQDRPVSLLGTASGVVNVKETEKASEVLKDMGTKLLLWDHMDDLIILVGRLKAWSRKSRPLHSSGLERVFKWLQGIQAEYVSFQNEADMQMLKTGILLLSSCWKHYGMLPHLEDYYFCQKYNGLLEEYLSGIESYIENHGDEPAAEKDSAIETIKFFLNCLSLLLGRLDKNQFEAALGEHGTLLSKLLVSLFRCANEDVVDSAICIFKAAIFKTHLTSSRGFTGDAREMDAALQMLLHLLEEHDGAAKAVVKLIAEYFSLCLDNHCLQNILKDLSSGNFSQRMNAIDIISDIIQISLESGSSLSHQMWQDMAGHLLQLLEDKELVIQTRASELLSVIDSSLVLPALVRLSCIANDRVQSLASETLLAVLKRHKDEPEVLCLLLDCLSNLCSTLDAAGDEKGLKLDTDRVLKLLPEWANMVEDWNRMISVLLDKLFEEPSNAVIVRSLSYISEQLADLADLVFHRLLLYAAAQKDIEESVSKGDTGTCQNVDSLKWQSSLFSHLCPLLVIRLLPLRVFDNLNSPIMYGKDLKENIMHDTRTFNLDDTECIAALLISRALNKFEFEDVRKLAAELCGRIHPHVLIPIISSQLGFAAKAEDTMKIKACLFSICTSLLVRRKDSYQHPGMIRIRKTIHSILSWCSIGRDDVLKVQHGCIDCLAWMICAELEVSKLACNSLNTAYTLQKEHFSGDAVLESSVFTYVISLLTRNENDFISYGGERSRESEAAMQISYRLCMANVLISACQKISEPGKELLAQKILQSVITSSEAIVESEIRAAWNQVLFSVVYHLKSAVCPFAPGILKFALRSLRDTMVQVRMTGAKLLASLMASEEVVVHSISIGLLEARILLQSLSSSDPSVEVRQLCQQLLSCMTS